MNITKVEDANKTFKPKDVKVREAKVRDLIEAERVSGKSSGFEFLCGVVSQCCTFDNQAQPPEEVQLLSMTDFLELTDVLGLNGTAISPATSSISSEKASSESLES